MPKNVKMKPLPDEEKRLKAIISGAESVIHYAKNRLAGTEGECECTAEDLTDAGDGPCNWCEQMMFSWDSLVIALGCLKPMVRSDRRWGATVKDEVVGGHVKEAINGARPKLDIH